MISKFSTHTNYFITNIFSHDIFFNNVSNSLTINADSDNVEFSGNKVGTAPENYVSNAIHNTSGTVNLNANADKSITFDDAITGSVYLTYNPTININQDAGRTGTIIFNESVTGQTDVNLFNGKLTLGKDGTNAKEVSNLNIKSSDAILDIQNRKIDNTIKYL